MTKNTKGVGPMPPRAETLLSRRLVRRTPSGEQEYIGVVGVGNPIAETIYYGYCKWGRVGGKHRAVLFYRGTSLHEAVVTVREKMRAKVAGPAGSCYETDDGRSVDIFQDRRNPTGVGLHNVADDADMDEDEVEPVPTARVPEALAGALLRRRGLPPNATIGDIMRRR